MARPSPSKRDLAARLPRHDTLALGGHVESLNAGPVGVAAPVAAPRRGPRPEGTLRERKRGHARPSAVIPSRTNSSACGAFVAAVARACPPSLLRAEW